MDDARPMQRGGKPPTDDIPCLGCAEHDFIMADHLAALGGIKRALRPRGRTILQFGGKDNAALISAVANEVSSEKRWKGYFVGFTYPWFFYSVEEYQQLVSPSVYLHNQSR
jgi:hypothetical protein